jgi:hypothetical protein
MKPQIHFRDALEWMAKAPPLAELESSSSCERVRQGRKGLAGGKG